MAKVPYADVLNNNTSLKQAGSGLVAVFVGATNGIGLGTLRALTKHTDSPTVYIVGRSLSRLDTLIAELKTINASATFHPIHAAELGLVGDAAKAAQQIAQSGATKIDLLFLSPGYAAFYREETKEGLEPQLVIQYYARMRFLVSLAPLLRQAPSSRVVSVLSAGNEGMLWEDDWGIKKQPFRKAFGVPVSMNSLFFEEFAKQPGNEKMVLHHTYPGWVGDTGFKVLGLPWVVQKLLDWVIAPLGKTFGITSEEAGERTLFVATSGRFRRLRVEDRKNAESSVVQKGVDGDVGSGVYLIGAASQTLQPNKVLGQLRKDGFAKKVYDHTLAEFERIEKL